MMDEAFIANVHAASLRSAALAAVQGSGPASPWALKTPEQIMADVRALIEAQPPREPFVVVPWQGWTTSRMRRRQRREDRKHAARIEFEKPYTAQQLRKRARNG